ncbi:Uncharacterised protein [Mycobacterium tuberculosis]|uniref:Uncharacterized protein n=1 Tax=Mycobacterium tuberculosis TaxID=1773 RepID=A0A916LA48_MYCTX|nr:Uncharacterised protein [Mycobacterium tuberculosis]
MTAEASSSSTALASAIIASSSACSSVCLASVRAHCASVDRSPGIGTTRLISASIVSSAAAAAWRSAASSD